MVQLFKMLLQIFKQILRAPTLGFAFLPEELDILKQRNLKSFKCKLLEDGKVFLGSNENQL